ncbi:hypothetical protein [Bacteroides faecis]|uniref:hypothetical protein n=1 Tax=Bacteroides faecis TaxID=674529 RepID=UPI001C3F843C|nr:hypothetical protein [Bacteroides faecis]
MSKKRGKIITDREELLVCQQYKDGWTLRKIATYANISQTTVMAILRRREVSLRNGKQITEEQEKQVVDLYLSGEKIKEIMSKTSVRSEQTIYRIINNAGVDKRR